MLHLIRMKCILENKQKRYDLEDDMAPLNTLAMIIFIIMKIKSYNNTDSYQNFKLSLHQLTN